METKVCNGPCGQEKPITDFYSKRHVCKECYKQQKKDFYWNNRDQHLATKKKYDTANKEAKKAYRLEHPEEIAIVKARYYKNNKQKVLETNRQYAKKYPERIAALRAKRRARKINQMPEDANKTKIREIYKLAKKLTKETGIQHHVDHIYPLSKGGLHHEDNLQILTAEENLRKSDKLPEEWYKIR